VVNIPCPYIPRSVYAIVYLICSFCLVTSGPNASNHFNYYFVRNTYVKVTTDSLDPAQKSDPSTGIYLPMILRF